MRRTRDRQYRASSMRRLFFSTSVARPAVQQLAASDAPVTVPVVVNPAHAPAVRHRAFEAQPRNLLSHWSR